MTMMLKRRERDDYYNYNVEIEAKGTMETTTLKESKKVTTMKNMRLV